MSSRLFRPDKPRRTIRGTVFYVSEHDEIVQLEAELSDAGAGKTSRRVDALVALALKIGYSDRKRTISLSKEAGEISHELDYPAGLAWGVVLDFMTNDYQTAEEYETALARGHEACDVFEALGETKGIADIKLGLGVFNWTLGDYERAISHLHEAIQLLDTIGEVSHQAWGLASLGGVYEAVGDLDKSQECQIRALELFRSIDDTAGVGRALTGLSAIHHRKGNLDEALKFSLRSLELADHEIGESRALNDIGTIYQAKGDFDKALDYLERALALRRKLGNRVTEVTSLLDLGGLLIETGAIEDAIRHLEPALQIAEAAGTRPKLYRAHEGLARAYEAIGEFERALAHQRQFHTIKEEVVGEESTTRLRNLQIKLEAEALEQLKRAQAQLIQSEKMAVLGKLVAGVAHEINTPVGVLISNADVVNRSLSRIATRYEEDQGLHKSIDAIRQAQSVSETATHRLGRIVESLKSFIHLDEADFQLTDVRQGIESTLSLIEPQWGERIRVSKRLDEIPRIEGYPTELNQALMTLLVNAGEAIAAQGSVTVTTACEADHIIIRVSDTGRGIPEELLSQIFDIGFTRSGTRIRLNVGLANVQAVATKHHGEIRAESEVGRGTSFEMRLPLRQGSG